MSIKFVHYSFVDVLQVAPTDYIPPPPSLPEAPQVQEILNALGEPTLASLGLANWTPSGLVQMALEALHVSADLPWWGAIVAGLY